MTEQQRTYPAGVPCWVDTGQPDPEAAARFYGGLFGWEFQDAVPADAPGSYLIARLAGQDVAAIAPGADEPPAWHTYIAVADADQVADRVRGLGGTVPSPPQDAGPGGRAATCADPQGAAFRLWQPRRRPGAQLVNAPGSWNFSILHTPDPAGARAFYEPLFGWESGGDTGPAWRRPGYGDHLERTVDPGIRARQAQAPPGFADVVAGVEPAAEGERPHWRVRFTVADRDDSVATAERLGGTVVGTPTEDAWTRRAVIRDPQGAELVLSQFAPTG